MLIDQILEAQSGNESEFLALINRFQGLFSKYGKKLGYEDAKDDLMADFIELIVTCDFKKLNNSSDGAIVNYIVLSCRRHYLHRLNNLIDHSVSCIATEDLSPAQKKEIDQKTAYWDIIPIAESVPKKALTKKEYQILLAIYETGLSATDIAAQVGVSRQNVNQIKKRAIDKLRKHLIIT
ncbi:sigma-70 family RNA polymerase sigma factor [Oscillibacter sp.]|uniref:sigma-70 family RNA polymerase sigma factor n=1 Tax=Oscillibacter sp. TaxID=1945593 RepID=UPI0028AE6178|nr:sigma-70 family RNA polymerase sigma factor [Oscillibacter sp.]